MLIFDLGESDAILEGVPMRIHLKIITGVAGERNSGQPWPGALSFRPPTDEEWAEHCPPVARHFRWWRFA